MMNGEPACTRGSGRCAESRRCSAGIFCRLGHGKLEEQTISAADRRLTDVTADHQLPDRRNLLCKKYAAGSIFQDQHKSGVSFSGISAIHCRAIESADRRSICRDFEDSTQTVREKTVFGKKTGIVFDRTLDISVIWMQECRSGFLRTDGQNLRRGKRNCSISCRNRKKCGKASGSWGEPFWW